MVVLASEGERAWRQRELNLNEDSSMRESMRRSGRSSTGLLESPAPDPDGVTVIFHTEAAPSAAPLAAPTLKRDTRPRLETGRLSEAILQDTRRAMRRGRRRGWDVGERPVHAMAYLEFPQHRSLEVRTRHPI